MHELLLHLIEVEQGDIFGRLRGRGEQGTVRCALVETVKAGVIDCLAHRLTAETAEVAFLPLYLFNELLFRR
jgi:hypothetical protein